MLWDDFRLKISRASASVYRELVMMLNGASLIIISPVNNIILSMTTYLLSAMSVRGREERRNFAFWLGLVLSFSISLHLLLSPATYLLRQRNIDRNFKGVRHYASCRQQSSLLQKETPLITIRALISTLSSLGYICPHFAAQLSARDTSWRAIF